MRREIEKFKESIVNRARSTPQEHAEISAREDLLRALAVSALDSYTIERALTVYSVEVVYGDFASWLIGRDTHRVGVVEGWAAVHWLTKFREKGLLEAARDYQDFSQFREKISLTDHSNFLWKCWALSGQYYFNLEKNWTNRLSFLEAAEIRGEIQHDLKWASFSSQRPFLQLIWGQEDTPNLLSIVSKYEPFEFLQGAWDDDGKFQEGLQGLCEWHIEQCRLSLKKDFYGYYLEPYCLLPIWIFALDRRRQIEKGNSCLPSNPLVDLGRQFLSSVVKATESPILNTLELSFQKYLDQKGLGNQDDVAFWENYTRQHRAESGRS